MSFSLYFRCMTGLGLAAALMMIVPLAQAQDFKEIAPKPVPPASTPPPEIVPPKSEPPVTANPNQVILAELKGIILQTYTPNFMRNPFPVVGIKIDDLPLLDQPDLRAKLTPFLNKQITFGDLQKIQQLIVAWYRDHNRPFVDVTFPEQDISGGVVQVIVTEFHLGQVRVEGNKWFSSDLLSSQVRISPGDPIDNSRLQEDLDRLNQNPFRQVAIVAEKSDTPGDTDLVLKTQDQFPL